MKNALENGFSIIRILQLDIFYNRIDWKKIILETIKQVETKSTPTVIYIDNNSSVYDNHRKLMEKQ